jgi:hypothetical protein
MAVGAQHLKIFQSVVAIISVSMMKLHRALVITLTPFRPSARFALLLFQSISEKILFDRAGGFVTVLTEMTLCQTSYGFSPANLYAMSLPEVIGHFNFMVLNVSPKRCIRRHKTQVGLHLYKGYGGLTETNDFIVFVCVLHAIR